MSERRPCAAWKRDGHSWRLDLGILDAYANEERDGKGQYRVMTPSAYEDNELGSECCLPSVDAAKIAAEDCAREALTWALAELDKEE